MANKSSKRQTSKTNIKEQKTNTNNKQQTSHIKQQTAIATSNFSDQSEPFLFLHLC
jgi:hypothetical protein